jgi:hypothetical protein
MKVNEAKHPEDFLKRWRPVLPVAGCKMGGRLGKTKNERGSIIYIFLTSRAKVSG